MYYFVYDFEYKYIGLTKSSFGFFCTISQKNPNKHFGQPYRIVNVLIYSLFFN